MSEFTNLSTSIVTEPTAPARKANVFVVIFLVLIGISSIVSTIYGIIGIVAGPEIKKIDTSKYIRTTGKVTKSCQLQSCQPSVAYTANGKVITQSVTDGSVQDGTTIVLWYDQSKPTKFTLKDPQVADNTAGGFLLIGGILMIILPWLFFGLLYGLFRFFKLV